MTDLEKMNRAACATFKERKTMQSNPMTAQEVEILLKQVLQITHKICSSRMAEGEEKIGTLYKGIHDYLEKTLNTEDVLHLASAEYALARHFTQITALIASNSCGHLIRIRNLELDQPTFEYIIEACLDKAFTSAKLQTLGDLRETSPILLRNLNKLSK